MPPHCAPNVNSSLDYTCFDKAELEAIAKAYNQYARNKPNHRPIHETGASKKELWQAIYDRLKPYCNYEHCWVDQGFIKLIPNRDLLNKIRFFTFKPKFTKTENNWLSTNDITNVLKQYENFDLSFHYAGTFPSDFYKVFSFDWDTLFASSKSALVLNLDKHDEPGSHWVAVFVDNLHRTVELFDSTGVPPPREIKTIMKKIMRRATNYKYLENKIVHQKEDGECGVYAAYYVIQRILGRSFQDISTHVISDSQIRQFRSVIFMQP